MFDFYRDLPPEVWQSPPVWIAVWIFAACWGSFLNVCIYRIPKELSVVHPGSHCFACKIPVAWYDNIPVLSWFILRGKCRNCGAPFSIRYAVIEALTGTLALAVWMVHGPTWVTLAYWLMGFGLLLGSGVDLDEFWIPDRVSIGGMVIGIPLSALLPELHQQSTAVGGLIAGGLGAAVGFGSLWLVGVIGKLIFKKDAMGFGDVKLLGSIGAFLGVSAVFYTIFVAALLGSVVGVTLILLKKNELGGRIPFGPYLSAAAMSWIFGGVALTEWYFELLRGPAVL